MANRTLSQCTERLRVPGSKNEVYCNKPAFVALYGVVGRYGWCWEHFGDKKDRARAVAFFKSEEGKAVLRESEIVV